MDYNLSGFEALAILQHYGLPTEMLDFTANPGVALTFALNANKWNEVGRICLLPTESFRRGLTVVELGDHPWAVRARRQDAFGVLALADPKLDFKSDRAREELGVLWFEFEITAQDREQSAERYRKLVSVADDPIAGILRHELIEEVERKGKLAPELVALVTGNIPMVPRAYRAVAINGDEGLVEHISPCQVGTVDEECERIQTEKYLSKAYPDDSRDRLHWEKFEIGKIMVDPRTWHPEGYGMRAVVP